MDILERHVDNEPNKVRDFKDFKLSEDLFEDAEGRNLKFKYAYDNNPSV